jgi:signal transduction histidine kinase
VVVPRQFRRVFTRVSAVPRSPARVQIERGPNLEPPRERNLAQPSTGRRWLSSFRGERGAALIVSPSGLKTRARLARTGSFLAFVRDGFVIAKAVLERLRRSGLLRRTLSFSRNLEIAWHASGAATHLADAALAGESTEQLAARIARIARSLCGAEAAAVFGRSLQGAVLFGSDGGVPAPDLAARTLKTSQSERRAEEGSRTISVPLRNRDALVGALVLRFESEVPVVLKPLDPLVTRAAAVLAAAEREARKDRFLSLAAHELKTPLTSIKGFAYSLSRRLEKGDPADPRSVTILERQAERLHGLLEEMLEVSRLEMGRFVLHQEPCELLELTQTALRSLRRLGLDGEVLVEGEGPFPLTVDRERVERAIAALIQRARVLGPPVTVRLSRDGTRAQLRVSWTDHPLSPAERASAFDARWEEPQLTRQGLGMALFIGRHGIAQHGGELSCDADALVLRLPLRSQATKRGAEGHARVLVVDADEPIARMLSDLLGEHGFVTDWAAGGRVALEKLRGSPADLLVLDPRMPDLDGRALVTEVRRAGMDPCIVLLSADRDLAAAAREMHAQAFVEKPFAPEALLAAVQRVLEKDRPI